MNKICKKCSIIKPCSDFSIRSDSGKLRNECRECLSIFKRDFKQKNKVKYKQISKKWYEANKEKVVSNNKLYAQNNREKVLANKKAYYAANELKSFAKTLKKKFNLTITEYEQMLALQNGLCAIYQRPETGLNNKRNKIRRLAVDHCHKTGKNRQLLCSNCNNALGLLKEDTLIAKRLIKYLEKHRE